MSNELLPYEAFLLNMLVKKGVLRRYQLSESQWEAAHNLCQLEYAWMDSKCAYLYPSKCAYA